MSIAEYNALQSLDDVYAEVNQQIKDDLLEDLDSGVIVHHNKDSNTVVVED